MLSLFADDVEAQVRLAHVTVGTLLGAALLLSGCTSTQRAGSLPPTTRTAAASTTGLAPLGPADFPVPAEARAQTADGATAFLKYYIELLGRAQQSNNSDGLRELSNDCDTCERFATGLDDLAADGYTTSGGGIEFNGASEPILKEGDAEFGLAITQLASTVQDSSGKDDPSKERRQASFAASGARLHWDEASSCWLISVLAIQSAS